MHKYYMSAIGNKKIIANFISLSFLEFCILPLGFQGQLPFHYPKYKFYYSAILMELNERLTFLF